MSYLATPGGAILINSTIAVILGFLTDCIIGDPHSWWHPVIGIGKLITFWEGILRSIFPKNPRGERIGGVFLVILVIASSLVIPVILMVLCYKVGRIPGILLESILCYQMLAAKSLMTESGKVDKALDESLDAGRYAVSMIVGRDTQSLSEEGVVKAAVETVAENTSDGIIAPMMFMAIGGGIAGYFYKAVNTMDSMVGYKNDKYRYFGTAAALFDDVCNFIPARVSGWLMIAAAYLLGMNGANAKKIFLRDRFNHDSPNSAQTEAVMAGALGVQLAGDAWYFGKLKKKKTIGDALRPVERADIGRSHRLMYGTSVLGLIVLVAVRLLIGMLICRVIYG